MDFCQVLIYHAFKGVFELKTVWAIHVTVYCRMQNVKLLYITLILRLLNAYIYANWHNQ